MKKSIKARKKFHFYSPTIHPVIPSAALKGEDKTLGIERFAGGEFKEAFKTFRRQIMISNTGEGGIRTLP